MKKAVMVWGGWDGHEPKQCVDIFEPWLKSQGYDVLVSDTPETFADAELMKGMDLIVPVYTQGEITREQETGLLEAVKSGVGIAGWHGGMGDSFRWSVDYQFKGHPMDRRCLLQSLHPGFVVLVEADEVVDPLIVVYD